ILGVKLSEVEILNSEIAEVENVDPKVSEAERTVDERVGNVAPTVVPDIQVESPVSKDRPNEPLNESPLSCSNKRLGTILEAAITSSPGILKRKVSDTTSPAIKSRRVSFAEHSQICEVESIPRSPGASPWRRNKYANPRVVKRRLSLPATKRCRADETPSPMSIRSATVAKAIAGIKVGEAQLTSQNQLSPSTGNKGPPSVEPPSSPSQRDRASLSHLCDVTYL
uniref:Uncharacterized protein n=1 Tax=Ciona savignyi TaxID=51511 RepID=H2YPP3_CIOSA